MAVKLIESFHCSNAHERVILNNLMDDMSQGHTLPSKKHEHLKFRILKNPLRIRYL